MTGNIGVAPEQKTRADGYLTISLDRLESGQAIHSPIYDDREDRNVLLLSAGTKITPALLEKIRRRGIQSVRIHRAELAQMEATKGRSAVVRPSVRRNSRCQPELPEETIRTDGDWGMSSTSYAHQIKQHGKRRYSQELVEQFHERFQSSLSQTDEFFHKLSSGTHVNDQDVISITQDSVLQIAKDSELFISLGISPKTGEYPMQHSLQSSMLAMSIGTTLGLSKKELVELGVGCLLHDVGMLRIDRRIYESAQILDPIQFLEITKHPTHTFEMIREMNGLQIGSRMVAYQTHERCNGSGYPRKRSKDQTHYLARIAAVADAFVAMISPRSYRPAYIPYHGLEEIIRGTRQHLFDPDIVRALLHTVSLFPIGSFVEMCDGRVGRVIRANGEEYTRPVVELWQPDHQEASAETVDLMQEPDLAIKAPLAELPLQTTEEQLLAEAENWE